MKGASLLGLCCIIGASLMACTTTPVYGTIPECDRLIPPEWRKPVEAAPMPQDKLHADGHESAEPWQIGWLDQTAQLDKANDRGAGIDHIYAECLKQHREALEKSQRGFFGRLFN